MGACRPPLEKYFKLGALRLSLAVFQTKSYDIIFAIIKSLKKTIYQVSVWYVTPSSRIMYL